MIDKQIVMQDKPQNKGLLQLSESERITYNGNLTEKDFKYFVESLEKVKLKPIYQIASTRQHAYMEAMVTGDKETMKRIEKEWTDEYEKNQKEALEILSKKYNEKVIEIILYLQSKHEIRLDSFGNMTWPLKKWSRNEYDYELSICFCGSFYTHLSKCDESGYDYTAFNKPVKWGKEREFIDKVLNIKYL